MLVCLLAESAWSLGLLAWLAKQVGGCFISVFTSLHAGLFAGKYHPDRDAADLGEIVLQTWGEDMAAEKLVLAVFCLVREDTQQGVTNILAIGDWKLYLLYTRGCVP